jgi:hypothetical protein
VQLSDHCNVFVMSLRFSVLVSRSTFHVNEIVDLQNHPSLEFVSDT